MPEDLTPREKWDLMQWCKREFPHWATQERLLWLVQETLDYHRATGNSRSYTSWAAVCRNRLRWLEAQGIDPFQARDRRSGGILERQPLYSRTWEEVRAEQERGADVIELSDFKGEER